MRVPIIKIGNSQGIRIPKPLLDQTGIKESVELEVDKSRIVIRAVSDPRSGWDEAFKAMTLNNDDVLIDGDNGINHSWDAEEWQW